MVAWNEFEREQPELAQRVRTMFDAGRHKTIATLRADGSPRISGIECEFVDGRLQFGSMPGARKLDDLRRDPRCAIHGPTVHPEQGAEGEWPGEAKISGRAESSGRIVDESGEGSAPAGELFVVDVDEVVVTGLNDDATALLVEWWTAGGGRRRVERA